MCTIPAGKGVHATAVVYPGGWRHWQLDEPETQILLPCTLQAATELQEMDRLLLADGEPQGISRLKSVLEAHVWPGLVLKDCPVRETYGRAAYSVINAIWNYLEL